MQTLTWAVGLFIAVNIADYLTTKKGLSLGLFENNPVINWVGKVLNLTTLQAVVLLKIALGIPAIIFLPTSILLALSWAVSLAVANNLAWIKGVTK